MHPAQAIAAGAACGEVAGCRKGPCVHAAFAPLCVAGVRHTVTYDRSLSPWRMHAASSRFGGRQAAGRETTRRSPRMLESNGGLGTLVAGSSEH